MFPAERPDPDRLLAEIKANESVARRGKLKIFFGACAGVGKTYAMLSAAQQRLAEGVQLTVGVVETHGRRETARLLEGLPVLPLRAVEYRGKRLHEFDVDAALRVSPQLIIIDELAHSNVEGSRHARRWQDVDEILAAGVDVYTSLNVQHLESVNDIVGGITGIRVRETVPDRFFDQADDVTLVDLPPDELLERLRDGKVYVAEQAELAAKSFFRKGNLIALREMALRRTADRVDVQMRDYRADMAISNVWHARERLVACIGPGPSGDKLVRSAARLAAELKADWIAVYVETPVLQRLPKSERQRILDHLQLAAELGAETVTLASSDPVATLLAYARSRNAGTLVLGRPSRRPWLLLWQRSMVDALALGAPDLGIHLVGADTDTSAPFVPPRMNRAPIKWRSFIWATAACAATTALASQLLRVFELSNVIMVFLLTVVGVSIRLGRGPGAWAAALSVLLFDFFFVPPKYSFAVADVQYLFTFALMLLVALVIGQLAASLRFEAVVANERERRAHALAALSKELAGALTAEQVIEIAHRHVSGIFDARVALLLPDGQDRLQVAGAASSAVETDSAVAQWVFDHGQPAGAGTQTLAATSAHYLPLRAPMRIRGVLALAASDPQFIDEPEMKRLLDTCSAQIALALERVHYVQVAQDALLSMEGERLRNSLLSAISHDLRTPLTVLVGLASTLADGDPPETARKEMTRAMQTEAAQMSELVTNLLDMVRLQEGGVKLNRDWQSMEEIVGSACAKLQRTLAGHNLLLSIPADLPLCECDPILIQRVIVNLLDNAAKFTLPGSTIEVTAQATGDCMKVSVEDNGPGLPPGQETRVFEKFMRGESESNKPGVGLGLALCKAIAEVHGGRIAAENRTSGGARFILTLPLGHLPPAMEEP
jgi:two-component system sensor histidine kinase KdpD